MCIKIHTVTLSYGTSPILLENVVQNKVYSPVPIILGHMLELSSLCLPDNQLGELDSNYRNYLQFESTEKKTQPLRT